jgi:hypothetical protein
MRSSAPIAIYLGELPSEEIGKPSNLPGNRDKRVLAG